MAGDYVNLNEVGVLTRSGQSYEGTAEDKVAEARNFSGRMEASQHGLVGSAGNTFQNVATGHTDNLQLLAGQIAKQALRAVRGESTIINADDDANSAQTAVAASVE